MPWWYNYIHFLVCVIREVCRASFQLPATSVDSPPVEPFSIRFEGQCLTRAAELNATSISFHLKDFNHHEHSAINSWSHALPIIPPVLFQKFTVKTSTRGSVIGHRCRPPGIRPLIMADVIELGLEMTTVVELEILFYEGAVSLEPFYDALPIRAWWRGVCASFVKFVEWARLTLGGQKQFLRGFFFFFLSLWHQAVMSGQTKWRQGQLCAKPSPIHPQRLAWLGHMAKPRLTERSEAEWERGEK